MAITLEFYYFQLNNYLHREAHIRDRVESKKVRKIKAR